MTKMILPLQCIKEVFEDVATGRKNGVIVNGSLMRVWEGDMVMLHYYENNVIQALQFPVIEGWQILRWHKKTRCYLPVDVRNIEFFLEKMGYETVKQYRNGTKQFQVETLGCSFIYFRR